MIFTTYHCAVFAECARYGILWFLGVSVPAASLFHDENFAFFDFGVRGAPKILKILLGVSP